MEFHRFLDDVKWKMISESEHWQLQRLDQKEDYRQQDYNLRKYKKKMLGMRNGAKSRDH